MNFSNLCKKGVGLMNLVLFAVLATVTLSCEKNSLPAASTAGEPSVVSISIVPENSSVHSRATGATHGVQADDNTVQTLEFFIFRTDGDDAGMLDTYKKFTSSELTGLTGININTTTGAKIIYAIANSHKADWTNVKTLSQFKTVLGGLKDEQLKNFTMTGSVEATLQVTSSVNISISRLVARVKLASIKTDFAGTPYQGSALENVKVYLTNVSADKLYANGANASNATVYNHKEVVAEQVELCNASMPGMLYDEISQSVNDAGYTTAHYFYCYENTLAAETTDKRFTKLVIQGDLNGHTYYYPISINQEGFGYSSANDHAGVKRNTAYSVEVTICRPGSNDPDKELEHGALTANVNILDWATVPVVQVNF